MFIHLQIEGFLVAVERARNTAWRTVPLVVGGRLPRGRVAAASAEAMAAGIRPGMSLRDARRLAPQCVCVEGHFERHRDAADRVDGIVRRWCRRVQWDGLDEVCLETAGRSELHPRAVAERVQAAVRKECALDLSAGIADTMVVAQVASRLARGGLLYVLPRYHRTFMAPLPVRLLPGLSESTLARLQAGGIASLGDLANARVESLESLIGPAVHLIQQLADGVDCGAFDAERLPRAVCVAVELLAGATAIVPEDGLNLSAARLSRELREAVALARTLRLYVEYENGTDRFHTILLDAATADADVLAAASAHLWRHHVCTDPPPRAVRLVATGLLSDAVQPSLFDARSQGHIPAGHRRASA